MIKSKTYFLIVTFVLGACNGHGLSSASLPTSTRSVLRSGPMNGTSPAPNGVSVSTHMALPLHVANAGETIRPLSRLEVAKRIGLKTSRNSALRVQGIALKRWADTDIARAGIQNPLIDPNREVYEVTTAFNTPYWIRANEWSSGHRIYIIDAVTGEVYLSRTTGNMIQSEAQIRSRLSQTARKPIVVLKKPPQ